MGFWVIFGTWGFLGRTKKSPFNKADFFVRPKNPKTINLHN